MIHLTGDVTNDGHLDPAEVAQHGSPGVLAQSLDVEARDLDHLEGLMDLEETHPVRQEVGTEEVCHPESRRGEEMACH